MEMDYPKELGSFKKSWIVQKDLDYRMRFILFKTTWIIQQDLNYLKDLGHPKAAEFSEGFKFLGGIWIVQKDTDITETSQQVFMPLSENASQHPDKHQRNEPATRSFEFEIGYQRKQQSLEFYWFYPILLTRTTKQTQKPSSSHRSPIAEAMEWNEKHGLEAPLEQYSPHNSDSDEEEKKEK